MAVEKNQVILEETIRKAEEQKQTLEALYHIAKDVLDSYDFEDTAKKLFNDCKKLTGATSGYIALLNEDKNENEVLFLDSGGADCTVDPTLPMPLRGLRGVAYDSGEVEYDNDYMCSPHWKFMPEGHMRLENVLFAPLKNDGNVIGLLDWGIKKADSAKRMPKWQRLLPNLSQSHFRKADWFQISEKNGKKQNRRISQRVNFLPI